MLRCSWQNGPLEFTWHSTKAGCHCLGLSELLVREGGRVTRREGAANRVLLAEACNLVMSACERASCLGGSTRRGGLSVFQPILEHLRLADGFGIDAVSPAAQFGSPRERMNLLWQM